MQILKHLICGLLCITFLCGWGTYEQRKNLAAITEKNTVGMTKVQVLKAYGNPENSYCWYTLGGFHEKYEYSQGASSSCRQFTRHKVFIFFKNGIVNGIKFEEERGYSGQR